MLSLRKTKDALNQFVWHSDTDSLPRWQARVVQSLRIIHAVILDISEGQITLRAMSLVYTTLLSLVPLLALSFSVLKAFGVHNQIEPLLLNVFAPLGEKGVEVTNRIIEFVENVRTGLLGSLGLAVLIYTVISLIQKIERSFNYIWKVTQQRPFSQRFSDYLSVIIIGPVLVFSALGLTASITSTTLMQHVLAIEPFGHLARVIATLLPYVLIVAAFTFIYIFVPNTRVRFGSALVGAIVAGVLWETTGWAFASFVANSARYTAIYSAFATLIVFMIWLYLSWLILLVGSDLAFYHQHREHVGGVSRQPHVSIRLREKLALLIMKWVAQNYHDNRPPWTRDGLAERAGLAGESVDAIITTLSNHGLLVRTAQETPAYLPGRDLDTISVDEIIAVLRRDGENTHSDPQGLSGGDRVDELFAKVEHTREQALQGYTLRDLLDREKAGSEKSRGAAR